MPQVGNLKNMYHFGMGSERMSPMSRNDGEVYTERLQSDPNVSGFKIHYLVVIYFCCVQVGLAIQQCLQKRSKTSVTPTDPIFDIQWYIVSPDFLRLVSCNYSQLSLSHTYHLLY